MRGSGRKTFYWIIGSILALLTLYWIFRRGGSSADGQHLRGMHEYPAKHPYQPTDYAAHDHRHGSSHDGYYDPHHQGGSHDYDHYHDHGHYQQHHEGGHGDDPLVHHQHPSHAAYHQDEHEHVHAHAHEHEHAHGHGHDHHHEIHSTEFHPTEDWQYVPDNVILPDGLELMTDHATGKRMARKHPVGLHAVHQDLPVAQQGRERNLIEQRLLEVVSENPAIQGAALDHMEVEAHRLNVGESIAHAKNFKNLIHLLETRSEAVRLKAATIIAGCLRTNRGAVQGALMSSLIRRAVERLQVEPDAEVQRRLIAILTYMAEGDLEGSLHQFDSVLGFTALEHILSHGLDPAAFTRTMVLLATMAREASHERTNKALHLLNLYLPKVKTRLDDAYMASFEPICEAEKHQTHSHYPHVQDFCRKFGTHTLA